MAHLQKPKTKVTAAEGIKPILRAKSQKRRKRNGDLAGIPKTPPRGRNDLLPRLAMAYAPIGSVVESSRRIRKKDVVQIARVKASIAKFGLVVPIIVDDKMQIVHGHAVYDAARELGLSELPVVMLSHLNADELRLLSITLNRLGETGTWDDENLKLEIEDLEIAGEDLSLSGFDPKELDILLLEDDDGDATETEVVPPLAQDAVSQPGNLWRLGSHLVLQGDATLAESYETLMQPGEEARAVVTDTPYNVRNEGHVTSQSHHPDFKMAGGEMSRDEFFVFLKSWLLTSTAHVMDGGLVATFIDWRSVGLVLNSGRELGFDLLNIIVWAKQNGGQGSFWRSQHELFPVFKKGRAPHVNNIELGRHGRWRSNVWQYPGASTLGSDAREGLKVHPTVKPRAMMEDALLDMTDRGEIIIDPFLGSGSTLLAAETTARRCRGIELDSIYCDLTIRRWQELTGDQAILVATGETFDELAQLQTSNDESDKRAPVSALNPDNAETQQSSQENDND